MGNSEAKETTYGYRIIKVAPDSPAKKAGLIEFLDYITDISSPNNKIPFSGNYGEFFKIIQNSEDQETTMTVYNILYRKARVVTITPSKKWENSDSLLGALVRYEEYASAYERALRVATVHENSPASMAGLIPETDYILGSPQYLYTDLSELANFIEMTQEQETIKSLELYVYNSQTGAVRSTLIMPNKNWGGPGQLGCEFALGFLNHLPHVQDESTNISTLDEQVDRLDDTDEDKSEHKSGNSIPEAKPENSVETKVEPEVTTGPARIEEPVQEKKEEVVTEIRPPTAAELQQQHKEEIHNIEHSHDAEQRAKLLHLAHLHKSSVKSIAKPFIKPGNSSANPFHTSESTEATTNQTTATTTHTETTEHQPSIVEKVKEEIKAVKDKIIHHEEKDKEQQVHVAHNTAVTQEHPKSAVPPQTEVEQGQPIHEVNRGITTQVQQQENPVGAVPTKENGENQVVESSEVVEKKDEEVVTQEKQVCKTTIEYNFFSKKLNTDYKIESMNLFNVEEINQVTQG